MTTHPRYRLRGDHLRDGYLDDLAPKAIDVWIVEGRACHQVWMDDMGYALQTPRYIPLKVDADGAVTWGGGVTFLPDPGEIDRIGRAYFPEAE